MADVVFQTIGYSAISLSSIGVLGYSLDFQKIYDNHIVFPDFNLTSLLFGIISLSTILLSAFGIANTNKAFLTMLYLIQYSILLAFCYFFFILKEKMISFYILIGIFVINAIIISLLPALGKSFYLFYFFWLIFLGYFTFQMNFI